ncbi:MAG: type IV pilus modification protein PilV [Azoarcus sp.]|jgi:type IV pilus assembly protein PilV|nr:type IV pilus modification protein PilV [Azoarcus sp.]
MNKSDKPGTSPRQTGSSLIEVLVSLFILAFGLLGIAGMQANALRNNQGAFERSAAVFLTSSILDAMRASMQPDAARPGEMLVRDGYATGNFICSTQDITASDPLVKSDLERWLQNIQENLNGGAQDANTCGKISCEPSDSNLCTVSVRWDDSRANGEPAQVLETRSRL